MPKIEINVQLPGEKLATKIWKTVVDNGIGGLLRPGQMRREGRALSEVRAERILMVAQARKDADDIRSGQKILQLTDKGQVVAAPPPDFKPAGLLTGFRNEPSFGLQPPPLELTDTVLNAAAREMERNINLQRIALYAEEQAAKVADEEVSEDPIALDWINKWRESAQDVTEEHMQRLWARILAEEARAPGSYRMRTLDFLRTLDKQDALKIAAIGPFVLDLKWIHRQDDTFAAGKGPTFDDLLELQDMGIIAGVGVDQYREFRSVSKEKFSNTVSCGGKALAYERSSTDPVQLPFYRLTALGQEVLRLGDYEGNVPYLKTLGLELKRKGFRVRYGAWIQKPGADSTWGYLSPDAVDV